MYTLKELTDKAFSEMLNAGYSYKTVYGSNWYIWNRLIRKYGADAIFDESMIYEYCNEYFGRDIFSIDKSKLLQCEDRYLLSFTNLIKSSENKPFEKLDRSYHRNQNLSEKTEILLEKYLEKSKNDGNAETTLQNKRQRIRNFLIDSNFDSLTQESLIKYLNMRKEQMNSIAYTIEMRLIRRFLVFCYEEGAISKTILMTWPSDMKRVTDKDIPSTYSDEEISLLLDASKHFEHEDNHLRNYAILCLVAYSGIRINDVVNLKLSNIDWRNNLIRFTQQKTKREHIVPLIPEIGNPIIEYITKERISSNEYIFTKENGEKMKRGSASNIISRYFSNAPFDLKGRHYGAHALRHSLATNLVNTSTPSFIVANVLGHSSTECVHIYAKVDLKNLRKCVLEVPYRA